MLSTAPRTFARHHLPTTPPFFAPETYLFIFLSGLVPCLLLPPSPSPPSPIQHLLHSHTLTLPLTFLPLNSPLHPPHPPHSSSVTYSFSSVCYDILWEERDIQSKNRYNVLEPSSATVQTPFTSPSFHSPFFLLPPSVRPLVPLSLSFSSPFPPHSFVLGPLQHSQFRKIYCCLFIAHSRRAPPSITPPPSYSPTFPPFLPCPSSLSKILPILHSVFRSLSLPRRLYNVHRLSSYHPLPLPLPSIPLLPIRLRACLNPPTSASPSSNITPPSFPTQVLSFVGRIPSKS
ncbi:hypothetical protein L873DRAFT_53633 [Choiromyces venosus 120613-1]|uniref:Uncharacterized protein n=1 Tax=Choiromyces venosus 120613-1 TaxID=1336337 RepID=A0A3N4J5T8_9PEZI|nr:hypothetical protein L873DRAFT_53633 [Choiromyces venosus 120613-1]